MASRATIYGYNLFADGNVYVTDVNEANAMVRNRVGTAVSNNSWGPVNGSGFDHVPLVWEIAIDAGVTQGYDGKGVFYVWAGGNGHLKQDNSNFGEYANYYGVTAVCAVGDDGIRSSYSEQGANLWVCAPSSGGGRRIVTTDNSDRYTNTFSGTSSATPKVAGVAALLRQANPDLTWRGLKLILAASARQNDAGNPGWEEGARKYGSTDDSDRYHFNHEYGFGVVDAAAAVALARDWSNLPEFQNASSASGTLNRTIPDNIAFSSITSSLSLDTEIDFTEFVEVNVTIDHPFWRDLRIVLVSPAGSVSELAVPVDLTLGLVQRGDLSPGTFRFGSAKHLGEDPNGTWTLGVADELARDQGTLQSWSIKVYGHRDPAPDLVVGTPAVPHSSPLTGASFTFWATVSNEGGAAAGSTTLRYYRSSDDTIDTNDTAVGTDPVYSLSAGASSPESTSLTAPSTEGTYYYYACVDAVSGESDTANNCSAAVTVTVGVAPVFSEGDSTERSVAENTVSGMNVGAAVTATDADNDTLTYSLEGTDAASFSIVSTRGQIRTVAALDHEAKSRYSVTVRADDGKGGTDTIAVTISVTDVNEGPEVSGSSTFTITENRSLSNAGYTATDPEGLDVTRWTVGGTDGGDFTISQEGVLTFRNTPDFERPVDSNGDNTYELQVRPYDGRYYGSFDVTVTVTDVNEPPTITTTSSSATALRQNENATSRLYTYRATDPEGTDTVAWSVGGVDARFFTITERGEFSFKEDSPPNYEQPGDSDRNNVYNVVVRASDDSIPPNTAMLPVTVTVRAVNEGPEVTSGSSSFTIDENQDLPNAVYEGFDPEGGTVTRWTVGGRDGGDFTISQEGVLTFRLLPDLRTASGLRPGTTSTSCR